MIRRERSVQPVLAELLRVVDLLRVEDLFAREFAGLGFLRRVRVDRHLEDPVVDAQGAAETGHPVARARPGMGEGR